MSRRPSLVLFLSSVPLSSSAPDRAEAARGGAVLVPVAACARSEGAPQSSVTRVHQVLTVQQS